ncbi:unnamed protein product [Amoebophrya sp. A120]|nr:unnamed protein product [Amoebophrya sp. A120]|eukprot:GSA120T00004249001.1
MAPGKGLLVRPRKSTTLPHQHVKLHDLGANVGSEEAFGLGQVKAQEPLRANLTNWLSAAARSRTFVGDLVLADSLAVLVKGEALGTMAKSSESGETPQQSPLSTACEAILQNHLAQRQDAGQSRGNAKAGATSLGSFILLDGSMCATVPPSSHPEETTCFEREWLAIEKHCRPRVLFVNNVNLPQHSGGWIREHLVTAKNWLEIFTDAMIDADGGGAPAPALREFYRHRKFAILVSPEAEVLETGEGDDAAAGFPSQTLAAKPPAEPLSRRLREGAVKLLRIADQIQKTGSDMVKTVLRDGMTITHEDGAQPDHASTTTRSKSEAQKLQSNLFGIAKLRAGDKIRGGDRETFFTKFLDDMNTLFFDRELQADHEEDHGKQMGGEVVLADTPPGVAAPKKSSGADVIFRNSFVLPNIPTPFVALKRDVRQFYNYAVSMDLLIPMKTNEPPADEARTRPNTVAANKQEHEESTSETGTTAPQIIRPEDLWECAVYTELLDVAVLKPIGVSVSSQVNFHQALAFSPDTNVIRRQWERLRLGQFVDDSAKALSRAEWGVTWERLRISLKRFAQHADNPARTGNGEAVRKQRSSSSCAEFLGTVTALLQGRNEETADSIFDGEGVGSNSEQPTEKAATSDNSQCLFDKFVPSTRVRDFVVYERLPDVENELCPSSVPARNELRPTEETPHDGVKHAEGRRISSHHQERDRTKAQSLQHQINTLFDHEERFVRDLQDLEKAILEYIPSYYLSHDSLGELHILPTSRVALDTAREKGVAKQTQETTQAGGQESARHVAVEKSLTILGITLLKRARESLLSFRRGFMLPRLSVAMQALAFRSIQERQKRYLQCLEGQTVSDQKGREKRTPIEDFEHVVWPVVARFFAKAKAALFGFDTDAAARGAASGPISFADPDLSLNIGSVFKSLRAESRSGQEVPFSSSASSSALISFLEQEFRTRQKGKEQVFPSTKREKDSAGGKGDQAAPAAALYEKLEKRLLKRIVVPAVRRFGIHLGVFDPMSADYAVRAKFTDCTTPDSANAFGALDQAVRFCCSELEPEAPENHFKWNLALSRHMPFELAAFGGYTMAHPSTEKDTDRNTSTGGWSTYNKIEALVHSAGLRVAKKRVQRREEILDAQTTAPKSEATSASDGVPGALRAASVQRRPDLEMGLSSSSYLFELLARRNETTRWAVSSWFPLVRREPVVQALAEYQQGSAGPSGSSGFLFPFLATLIQDLRSGLHKHQLSWSAGDSDETVERKMELISNTLQDRVQNAASLTAKGTGGRGTTKSLAEVSAMLEAVANERTTSASLNAAALASAQESASRLDWLHKSLPRWITLLGYDVRPTPFLHVLTRADRTGTAAQFGSFAERMSSAHSLARQNQTEGGAHGLLLPQRSSVPLLKHFVAKSETTISPLELQFASTTSAASSITRAGDATSPWPLAKIPPFVFSVTKLAESFRTTRVVRQNLNLASSTASAQQHFQGENYNRGTFRQFNDQDCLGFIQSHPLPDHFPEAEKVFMKYLKHGPHRADWCLLWVLYHNGGIHLDSDVMVYENFLPFLAHGENAAVSSRAEVIALVTASEPFSVDTGVFGTTKKNKLVLDALSHIYQSRKDHARWAAPLSESYWATCWILAGAVKKLYVMDRWEKVFWLKPVTMEDYLF